MAFKDGSQTVTFQMWVNGKTIQEIIRRLTATERTVRNWVLDWEKGEETNVGSETVTSGFTSAGVLCRTTCESFITVEDADFDQIGSCL